MFGRLASLRVLGIPVSIDTTFAIGSLLMATIVADGDGLLAAIVVAGIGASILVHELGHALVFRAMGASPTITLTGFGGATTTNVTTQGWSSWRDIVTTAAGPAAGLLLAAACWAVLRVAPPADPTMWNALQMVLALNLIWSVGNLLPVLPLDGGQILRDVLTLARLKRPEHVAGIVSIVVAGIGAGVAVWARDYVILAVAGYLGHHNWTALRVPHHHHNRHCEAFKDTLGRYLDGGELATSSMRAFLLDGSAPKHVRTNAAAALLHPVLIKGRTDEPDAMLRALAPVPRLRDLVPKRPQTPMSGLVAARTMHTASPGVLSSSFVVRELAELHRWDELRDFAVGHDAELGLLGSRSAQALLFYAGRYSDAAVVGLRAWHIHGAPVLAYNLACCASKTGDVDGALEWLTTAIEAGFSDADQIERDEDLEALRQHPQFPMVRERLVA